MESNELRGHVLPAMSHPVIKQEKNIVAYFEKVVVPFLSKEVSLNLILI